MPFIPFVDSAAHQTLALAMLGAPRLQIVGRQRMASRAVGFPLVSIPDSSRCQVGRVNGLTRQFKMGGIATRRVLTAVVQNKSIGDGRDNKSVGDAVRGFRDARTSDKQFAVSKPIFCSREYPTPRSDITDNLAQQPLFKGSRHTINVVSLVGASNL